MKVLVFFRYKYYFHETFQYYFHYTSLLEHGAQILVDRCNVDMEDQGTIDMWITKVLGSIADLEVEKSQDYLPTTLDTQSEYFHRNWPFYARIKVCICYKYINVQCSYMYIFERQRVSFLVTFKIRRCSDVVKLI